MGRDWWFVLGVIGAALTCLACLTPIAVLVLGAIGLGAWTGRLDLVLLPLLVGFVVLAVYRYRLIRRRRGRCRPARHARVKDRSALSSDGHSLDSEK